MKIRTEFEERYERYGITLRGTKEGVTDANTKIEQIIKEADHCWDKKEEQQCLLIKNSTREKVMKALKEVQGIKIFFAKQK